MTTILNISTASVPEQRKALIAIEREIKELHRDWSYYDEVPARVIHLLKRRKYILNNMFNPSDEAMRHFNRVNATLATLSERLDERADALRQTASLWLTEFDQEIRFKACIEFDADLECDIETARPVINLSDNGWYGSDFEYMINLLAELYELNEHSEIISFVDYIVPIKKSPNKYSANRQKSPEEEAWQKALFARWLAFKTDKPCDNCNEFGSHYPFNGRPEFRNIKITKAVHILCKHKMYAIPDVLRMNCFRSGIHISIENLRTQKDRIIK